jgi:4-hydroxy-tetrahydrodipicolinate reductase
LQPAREGVPIVIGTTDVTREAADAEAAKTIPDRLCAPNMSVGVNVTLRLLEVAAVAWPLATTSRS